MSSTTACAASRAKPTGTDSSEIQTGMFMSDPVVRPRTKLSWKMSQPQIVTMTEKTVMKTSAATTQTRCQTTGSRLVTAFTVMCRRVARTCAMARRQPQIRQSWLSSAAQIVGLMKK